MQNEITVLVTCDYETLHNQLLLNGFSIKESYEVLDDYMIHKDINILEMTKLDVLKKCVLIRNIVGIDKKIVYKDKKYASNGDIIEQRKIECSINNIEDAIKFMEAINYKKLFKIYDKCIVYSNDKTELIVQLVNNEYIFIEMESKCEYLDKEYSKIQDMIDDLNSYNLSHDKSNYFVKKAEIMLDKVIKENKY